MATGKEWSKEEQALALHGAQQVMLYDPAPLSAADRNVRATLDKLREWLSSGVPLPPAGAGWETQPGVSVSGFTISVDDTGRALFQGDVVPFPAFSYTATAPGEGLLRLVILYAKPDGTYGVSIGDAAQNPVQPTYPATALFVSMMVVTPTGGIIQQPTSYVTSVTVRKNGVDGPVQTGAAVVDLGTLDSVDDAWLDLADAASLTLSFVVAGKERPNQRITPALLENLTGPGNLPIGKDLRLKFVNPGGKSITLAGTGHTDLFGKPIPENKLQLSSDPEQVLLINNAGGHLTWSLTGENGTAAAPFTPITAAQFNTYHPAFNDQHSLNVWLLQNMNTYR